MNSVTSPPVAGVALVGRELHADGHVAGREVFLGDLFEDEHAHHRVGVGELAVLDVEREPAEVVGFGDDHAFGAALGHDEVGGDRVRAVVDPRDHARHHVLDVAAELERGLLRDRGQDAEERRERAEQREHLVSLGLLPEQLLELLDLLGVLGGEVVRLGEVVGEVVQLGADPHPGPRRPARTARALRV